MIFQKAKYDAGDIKFTNMEDNKDSAMADINKKAELNNELFGGYNINAFSSGKSNNMFEGNSNGPSYSPFQRVDQPQLGVQNFGNPPELYNYNMVRYPEPYYNVPSVVISSNSQNSQPMMSPQDEGSKDKKEKNRLSAKECRKRKKQYIESLESEIAQQKEEIKKYKSVIEEYRERELQLTNEKKMLQTVLSTMNGDPEEMRNMYDPSKCHIRRAANVTQSFTVLIDNMISSLNRYVLWYPMINIEPTDKKVKKVIKYTSVDEKNAQEYHIY